MVNTRQEFYTIRGTNKIVRVGDTVSMKLSKFEKSFWPNVGRVKKFEFDPKGEIKMVWVRYYYRPEEVVQGRHKFHGRKELFLSGHYDLQSADAIEGKCNIYNFKKYIKLENVRPEDFYCRFEYNICTGAFIPERVAVYCKCELPRNPDDMMIKCEGCKELFHPACVEMTIEHAQQLDSYICSDCEPKDNVAEKSVASKRKRAQQVATDMEEDKSGESPIVKQLKSEVKELREALGEMNRKYDEMNGKYDALQAHMARIAPVVPPPAPVVPRPAPSDAFSHVEAHIFRPNRR